MKFQTLVVKILLKQNINEDMYFLVKKWFFEQLKFNKIGRSRWSCRKHPPKILDLFILSESAGFLSRLYKEIRAIDSFE